jgi:hypothetical protein
MDWQAVGMALATVIVVPAGGWTVSSIIRLDKKLGEHTAVDAEAFRHITESLHRLEETLKVAASKMDDVVERLPRRRR